MTQLLAHVCMVLKLSVVALMASKVITNDALHETTIYLNCGGVEEEIMSYLIVKVYNTTVEPGRIMFKLYITIADYNYTCVEQEEGFDYLQSITLFDVPEEVTSDTIVAFSISDIRTDWSGTCSICGPRPFNYRLQCPHSCDVPDAGILKFQRNEDSSDAHLSFILKIRIGNSAPTSEYIWATENDEKTLECEGCAKCISCKIPTVFAIVMGVILIIVLLILMINAMWKKLCNPYNPIGQIPAQDSGTGYQQQDQSGETSQPPPGQVSVSKTVKIRPLTDRDILRICDKVTNKTTLRQLAEKLNVGGYEVDSALTNHPSNIQEATQNVLNKWMQSQQNPSRAFENMYKALCKAGLGSIANDVLIQQMAAEQEHNEHAPSDNVNPQT